MIRQFLADTWFFIALHDRFDMHNGRARAIQARLGRSVLVTHDAVLTELLAHFADDGPYSRRRVSALAHELMRTIRVIPPDRTLFLRALARYEQRPDKEYSLVDCMSMIVMEDHGITTVLTNDHHFTQAGFTVVSE